MSDPELRDLTASEPLTLQEEYEMQQTWQKDEDKLTFIILSRQAEDGLPIIDGHNTQDFHLSPEDPRITALPMVGDVNLFLKGVRPRVVAGLAMARQEWQDEFEVEVEIMIAEKDFRRKGLALETLLLLLTYATGQYSAFIPGNAGPTSHCQLRPYLEYIQLTQSPPSLTSIVAPDRLVSRISDTNEPSIRLFEKLGFRIVKTVEVFHEVEMWWQQTPRLT